VITYELIRDNYRLSLSLDDDTRSFTVACKPPGVFEQEDVQKQTRKWAAHVARGFAQRHRLGYIARVKFIEGDQVGELRGKILPV
jgi:hypothetical protein